MMEIIKAIIQILAGIASCLAAFLSVLLFVRLRWPSAAFWILKLLVSALSPVFVLIGIVSSVLGIITGSLFIGLTGGYVACVFYLHIYRITSSKGFRNGMEESFGLNWQDRISPNQKKHFLSSRYVLKLPAFDNSQIEQNIPFATIPGTNRKLLCDVWQPPESIPRSGLAFLYLHGSAWYLLDKDLGTRPMFSHLTAHGHVIMDVAYRLSPETDMMGMIQDVKRAIIWMKENAITYKVYPDRIVVGGGSAGGHLALMAAYTATNSQFTPNEIEGKDCSVDAVISFYGPSNLEEMYYHTNQHLTTKSVPGRPKKKVPTEMPAWMKKGMGKDFERLGFNKGMVNAGSIAPMLGAHPDEDQEPYILFSPVTHVHPNCPATLLLHGRHDIMAPVGSTQALQALLKENGIQTVMDILPQTDHAFDLVFTKISPSAHTAFYDIERFLAFRAIHNEQ